MLFIDAHYRRKIRFASRLGWGTALLCAALVANPAQATLEAGVEAATITPIKVAPEAAPERVTLHPDAPPNTRPALPGTPAPTVETPAAQAEHAAEPASDHAPATEHQAAPQEHEAQVAPEGHPQPAHEAPAAPEHHEEAPVEAEHPAPAHEAPAGHEAPVTHEATSAAAHGSGEGHEGHESSETAKDGEHGSAETKALLDEGPQFLLSISMIEEAGMKESQEAYLAKVSLLSGEASTELEAVPVLLWQQEQGVSSIMMRAFDEHTWVSRIQPGETRGKQKLDLIVYWATPGGKQRVMTQSYTFDVRDQILTRLDSEEYGPNGQHEEVDAATRNEAGHGEEGQGSASKGNEISLPMVGLHLLWLNLIVAFAAGLAFALYHHLPQVWLDKLSGEAEQLQSRKAAVKFLRTAQATAVAEQIATTPIGVAEGAAIAAAAGGDIDAALAALGEDTVVDAPQASSAAEPVDPTATVVAEPAAAAEPAPAAAEAQAPPSTDDLLAALKEAGLGGGQSTAPAGPVAVEEATATQTASAENEAPAGNDLLAQLKAAGIGSSKPAEPAAQPAEISATEKPEAATTEASAPAGNDLLAELKAAGIGSGKPAEPAPAAAPAGNDLLAELKAAGIGSAKPAEPAPAAAPAGNDLLAELKAAGIGTGKPSPLAGTVPLVKMPPKSTVVQPNMDEILAELKASGFSMDQPAKPDPAPAAKQEPAPTSAEEDAALEAMAAAMMGTAAPPAPASAGFLAFGDDGAEELTEEELLALGHPVPVKQNPVSMSQLDELFADAQQSAKALEETVIEPVAGSSMQFINNDELDALMKTQFPAEATPAAPAAAAVEDATETVAANEPAAAAPVTAASGEESPVEAIAASVEKSATDDLLASLKMLLPQAQNPAAETSAAPAEEELVPVGAEEPAKLNGAKEAGKTSAADEPPSPRPADDSDDDLVLDLNDLSF